MVKRSSFKYLHRNQTVLLLSIGALFVVIFAFIQIRHSSLTQNSTLESTVNSQIENKATEGRVCTGDTIIDKQAGFSIICPTKLKLYVYRDEYNQFIKKQEKIVFLCESQINSDIGNGYYLCPSGGIMIWANGDGWGGGCDQTYKSTIMLNNEGQTYCLYSSGFGQLYSGDTYSKNSGNSFLIQGSFSQTFKKEDALNALASFKTL